MILGIRRVPAASLSATSDGPGGPSRSISTWRESASPTLRGGANNDDEGRVRGTTRMQAAPACTCGEAGAAVFRSDTQLCGCESRRSNQWIARHLAERRQAGRSGVTAGRDRHLAPPGPCGDGRVARGSWTDRVASGVLRLIHQVGSQRKSRRIGSIPMGSTFFAPPGPRCAFARRAMSLLEARAVTAVRQRARDAGFPCYLLALNRALARRGGHVGSAVIPNLLLNDCSPMASVVWRGHAVFCGRSGV